MKYSICLPCKNLSVIQYKETYNRLELILDISFAQLLFNSLIEESYYEFHKLKFVITSRSFMA